MSDPAANSPTSVPLPTPAHVLRVLLVDQEPQVRQLLSEALRGPNVQLIQAGTLAEARRQAAGGPIDLALIEPALPDGSGIALAEELRRARPTTQTIVMSEQPSLERAVEAIRAGAADFLLKPLNLDEVNQRVREALARHDAGAQQRHRIARLRRICKKLNQAREEVTQQVDILCNDLVTAYQELAQQMSQVVDTSEFAGLVRDELDLEGLLRKTLEFLLRKAGPTNAAVFLPASADEFTLGGYVNYECTSESADVLLQHLADVVAPKVAAQDAPLHLTEDAELTKWIGDDAAYLADAHVIAFACRREGEPLAVIVLFRDKGEPYSPRVAETCAAIGPMLAEYLARIIRIHHRSLPSVQDEGA